MQHLKEFLTNIQTFDLRIIDDEKTEWGTSEKKHIKTYDILYNTQYNDSTTYRSKLRVLLREMAFIDILTQDKERIKFHLVELRKVRKRFQDFWEKYHENYSEMKLVYERSFVSSVYLEYWFIVNLKQHDHSNETRLPEIINLPVNCQSVSLFSNHIKTTSSK
jgi:hypothetical protein